MRRLWVVLVIVCVVGALAAAAFYKIQQRTDSKNGAPSFEAARVERGQIVLTVATTGRVVANRDVEIKCKASGEIVTLPYDLSDPVKKGELILELDPVDEERKVKQTKITLSAAQARLARAQSDLLIAERRLATDRRRAEVALKAAEARAQDARNKAKRFRELLDKRLASPEQWETAETVAVQAAADSENAKTRLEELKTEELALDLKRQDVQQAAADVELARIMLSEAQQRLKDTKVTAPMDGVVSFRGVQTGQIISSAISNVGGGTTVLTLSDLSRLFVLASVDESDIGKVASGQPVSITADAFPEMRFRGTVVRIATRGVNASNVVTFEVKIEVVSRNKSLLKPEMTTNVEIIAAESKDALLVPNEALSRRRQERVCVVAKDDGTTEERNVEAGISDGVKTEIISGLSEGERVVVQKALGESRWQKDDPRATRRMMRVVGGSR